MGWGISSGLPHWGHLTRLPAKLSGAAKVFPQLQVTEIGMNVIDRVKRRWVRSRHGPGAESLMVVFSIVVPTEAVDNSLAVKMAADTGGSRWELPV